MIEISKCSKGSKRLLEFMRYVDLIKRLHISINVHWNLEVDDIVLEFSHGLKVRSIMFEGLSDDIVTNWLYSLYRLGEKMTLKCIACGNTFLPGTNKQGLPTGVGFETEDGSIITICTNCINEIGKKFQRCRRGDNDER